MHKDIFFTSTYNADDMTQWSGLGFYMKKMLMEQGFNIEKVYPLEYQPGLSVKIKSRIARKMVSPREISTAKNYAKQIEKIIGQRNGIIFSTGTLPVAYLNIKNPIVIYTDATFASILSYYDEFSSWTKSAIRKAHQIEKAALDRADLILFASEWAAKSAINFYDVDPSKIEVIPFGANISEIPDFDDVLTSIKSKIDTPLEILFVGVDWKRKGGDKVLEAFNCVIDKGINAHFHIVGPHTNPLQNERNDVTYYGFLNKHNEIDEKVLKNLFSKAHFFVMLSKSECYGLVYCEANAYGTPVIGLNTGGVSAIITDKNGALFDVGSNKEAISELLISLFQSKDLYYSLCVSSYERFVDNLNWGNIGIRMKKLLKKYDCFPQTNS
jgi:glycosyltransferase involved in cell wall biosynthesis